MVHDTHDKAQGAEHFDNCAHFQFKKNTVLKSEEVVIARNVLRRRREGGVMLGTCLQYITC